MRSLVATIVAAVILCGCAEFIPVPPRPVPANDFCAVENFDGYALPEGDSGRLSLMLRFAQPTAGNLACMRDVYRLTDVFQLDLVRDPVVPGITNHYHPLNVLLVTEAEFDAVAAEMIATCAKPGKVCGIHCAHGQDRTGAMSLAWLWSHLAHTPDNVDAVYADLMRHGFHSYRALWKIISHRLGW